MQLGEREIFATEWYQPLNRAQTWYVKPSAGLTQRSRSLFVDGLRVSEFDVRDRQLGLELGMNFTTAGQLKLGGTYRNLRADTVTGLPIFVAQRVRSNSVYAGLEMDTLDERYFATRGHAVVTAHDGAQALRLAEQSTFDVVISDLRMPGMNGLELIRQLRPLPSCANTRFMISTGDATALPLRRDDASMAGVVVVSKPYDVDALCDLVEAG